MLRLRPCWIICAVLVLALAAGCGGRATSTGDAAVKDGDQKDSQAQKDSHEPPPDGPPPLPDNGAPQCGTIAGLKCPGNMYCDLYGCMLDPPGVCVVVPKACPRTWAPQCGCDDRTYANACQRQQAQVALRHEGECQQPPVPDAGPGKRCGPFPSNQCGSNQWCDIHGCGATQLGTCVPRRPCTYSWAPVCGCDNKTYSNDCIRLSQSGVPLKHTGQCLARDAGFSPPPDSAPVPRCSASNPRCPPGSACLIQGCGKNSPGSCVPHGPVCPPLWAPVCGCDKKTYANTCTLLNAGQAMLRTGAC
jgi:hypothetical protein